MTAPQRHDRAVAFCCDRNYFRLALFMVRQIAFHNPHRVFDFVIASRDDLEVPDWAKPLGIVIHRIGAFPDGVPISRCKGSVAPLFRLMMVRELAGRYRRILYLDCDMFVEGGDFNRLLDVDIGPHPIGAVLDAPFFYENSYLAKEFYKAGLPPMPYANTGMQLIDSIAYAEQEVERRSFDVCITHPETIIYTDQSLTNMALRGKFAQLAPCWNWQCNSRLLLVPFRYPVFLRHFIGGNKPDRHSGRMLEARFNLAYREFLTQLMPEYLPDLAPQGDPSPLKLREIGKLVMEHVLARKVMAAAIDRHGDPYQAIV